MIGKKIQEERKKLGITQNQMAKHLKCKQSNISTIENTDSSTSTIVNYMKFFRTKGVDLNKLFEES